MSLLDNKVNTTEQSRLVEKNLSSAILNENIKNGRQVVPSPNPSFMSDQSDGGGSSSTVYNEYPGEAGRILPSNESKYRGSLNQLKDRLKLNIQGRQKSSESMAQTSTSDLEEIFDCSNHLESSALLFLLESQDLKTDLSLADARCQCLEKRLAYIQTVLQSIQEESLDDLILEDYHIPTKYAKSSDLIKSFERHSKKKEVYTCGNKLISHSSTETENSPKRKERLRGGQTNSKLKSPIIMENLEISKEVQIENHFKKPIETRFKVSDDQKESIPECSLMTSKISGSGNRLFSTAIQLSPPKQSTHSTDYNKENATIQDVKLELMEPVSLLQHKKAIEDSSRNLPIVASGTVHNTSVKSFETIAEKPKKTVIRYHSHKKYMNDFENGKSSQRMQHTKLDTKSSSHTTKKFVVSSLKKLEEDFTDLSRKCEDIVDHLTNRQQSEELLLTRKPFLPKSNQNNSSQIRTLPNYYAEKRNKKITSADNFSTCARSNEIVQIVTTVKNHSMKVPVDVSVTSNKFTENTVADKVISQSKLHCRRKKHPMLLTKDDLYWE